MTTQAATLHATSTPHHADRQAQEAHTVDAKKPLGSHHPIEDALGIGRNHHILVELAKASLALRNATRKDEQEGMEELIAYLTLELEKRARYSHYYDELKAKHPSWFTRIAGQFRIGSRVARELNANRQSPAWIKARVEFWVKKALEYYWHGIAPGKD